MKKHKSITEQFKAIFEATPSPYLILETDAPYFTIVAVNDAYAKITNTSRENITGKGLFEVFPDNPEDQNASGVTNLHASLMKVLESKKAHKMSIQRYDIPIHGSASFEMRYWGLQNLPVPDENGEVLYIVHSVFDVTEKVLIEKREMTALQQLRAANHNLYKSNKELERFAFVVSHDLQEPVRKINTFGNMLKTRPGKNDGDIDLLNRILQADERMRTLIDDVLSYYVSPSSVESFQTVDLMQLINKVIQDLDNIIKEKKAIINVAKLRHVKGSAPQFRQTFQNLLSNSLKFSKPDVAPIITITSRIITAQESKIKISQKQENVKFQQIEIADNGIGFEQEYAEKIFQVFERLHGHEVYPGSGIGLSIVQKLIENHHGYISAEGELNKGSVFRILLPLP